MWSRRLIVATALCVSLLAAGTVTGAEQPEADRLSLTLREVTSTDYPKMTARVGIPAELGLSAGDTPSFEVTENGVPLDVLAAKDERLQASQEIVLVIDVSGSMKGRPLEDARRAAARFVEQIGSDASIGVIGVASDPVVVSEFTRDQSALLRAIGGLEASGETALYDSLRAAVRLKSAEAGGGADRVVVLLSDGGDTTSVTTLDQVSRAVSDAGVPLLAVAIESQDFNQKALRLLAKRSGGRVIPVRDTGRLEAYFEQLAEEITGGYAVTFRSQRPSSKDLDIDITARSESGVASVFTSVPNPMFVERVSLAGVTIEYLPANPVWMGAALLLIFCSVGLLAFGGLMAMQRRDRPLDQVSFYDQLEWESRSAADNDVASQMSGRIVSLVDQLAKRGGFEDAIASKLDRAGMRLRTAEYMTLHVLLVLVAGSTVQLIAGRTFMSVAAVILASAAPILYLNYAGDRRVRKFEEQLPDALNLVAGGLRTGWGLQQALDLVVAESAPPISDEFRRVQIEARLGIPVEKALGHMATRLGSNVLHWVVTAVSIQREVGGNLAEVLDSVAKSIRDRDALKRQVDALSAESRLSAIILSLLPFVVAGGLLVVSPQYISGMAANPLGLMLMVIAAVLVVVGMVWLRALTRFEY